jgi:hypothetical protein
MEKFLTSDFYLYNQWFRYNFSLVERIYRRLSVLDAVGTYRNPEETKRKITQPPFNF